MEFSEIIFTIFWLCSYYNSSCASLKHVLPGFVSFCHQSECSNKCMMFPCRLLLGRLEMTLWEVGYKLINSIVGRYASSRMHLAIHSCFLIQILNCEIQMTLDGNMNVTWKRVSSKLSKNISHHPLTGYYFLTAFLCWF